MTNPFASKPENTLVRCTHGCPRMVRQSAMAIHYLTSHLMMEQAAVRVYDLLDERDERAAGVEA